MPRSMARYAEDTLKTILGRIEPIAAGERPKVYYARGPRGLSTGLGGSINVETIEMLGRNVAGETQGGLANVSIEQILLWNPDVIVTIDQEFAASVRSDPSWASVKAVRDNRVHLSPKMPFGWVDFPPGVNRLIGLWWLAKILYPERFPEDLRDADAGLLFPLLSCHAVGGANRPCTCGPGLIAFRRMNTCPIRRARICHRRRGADRRPAAGADRRPLSGEPRRSPQRALRQGGRPPCRRGTGGRKRDLAGSRAARDRGDAGGRGARGRRHRVSGAVSQSAGLARYSRGIVGRGARRRGRHLPFAQRVRDPGGRLSRRADRGRRSSM